MTDLRTVEEQFKQIEPLMIQHADDQPTQLACIEDGNDPLYAEHKGRVWLGHNWLDVGEARALRDWLNKVLP